AVVLVDHRLDGRGPSRGIGPLLARPALEPRHPVFLERLDLGLQPRHRLGLPDPGPEGRGVVVAPPPLPAAQGTADLEPRFEDLARDARGLGRDVGEGPGPYQPDDLPPHLRCECEMLPWWHHSPSRDRAWRYGIASPMYSHPVVSRVLACF